MIRGVSRSGRIAWVVGVVVALAVAAPAAAGAQSAVEEYSLDIPGGGGGTDSGSGGGTDSGTPTSGTPSTGATASGTPSDTSSGGGAAVESSSGGDEGNGADPSRADEERRSQGHPSDELDFSGIHDGGSNALDTNSRSAPEVVADTLLDGAMLPILAALVLITGVGAWRVLHSRGALSRQAG